MSLVEEPAEHLSSCFTSYRQSLAYLTNASGNALTELSLSVTGKQVAALSGVAALHSAPKHVLNIHYSAKKSTQFNSYAVLEVYLTDLENTPYRDF